MEHEDKALGAVTAPCGATKTALVGAGDDLREGGSQTFADCTVQNRNIGFGTLLLIY